MSYKLIILAPSAGGKSTLMRYLREHTDFHVAETDEEVVRANNGEWPSDDQYKNEVLIPQTINEIISRDQVIYLMKDMPIEQLRKAKQNGFKVVILKLSKEQLLSRNKKRMVEEGYDDAAKWFDSQLQELDMFDKEDLVDQHIDGDLSTEEIAQKVMNLKDSWFSTNE
jgi:guanylate kinase